jgi:hypothetical protein
MYTTLGNPLTVELTCEEIRLHQQALQTAPSGNPDVLFSLVSGKIMP